jgi:ABC-type lipoprotein export system ATPase subunit
MDEPFGALDSITRSEIHQEIVQLQKIQPRTNLLVTHDAGYFSLLTCRTALKIDKKSYFLPFITIIQSLCLKITPKTESAHFFLR